MKAYLSYEDHRNRLSHPVFEAILRLAFGRDASVLVAHHLTFTLPDGEPNEIPSADTLIFDHEIMGRVFGERSKQIMADLALTPTEQRDALLSSYLSGCSRKQIFEERNKTGPQSNYAEYARE